MSGVFGTGVMNFGGTPGILEDQNVNRPPAGIPGRLFIATDSGQGYRDTGTFWQNLWTPATPTAWTDGGNAFGSLGILGTTDNFSLALISNNVERARLLNTGQLLIGATAAPAGTNYNLYDAASTIYTGDALNNVGVGINVFGGNAPAGLSNLGIGNNPLNAITTGAINVGIGVQALPNLTTGARNVGIGRTAGIGLTGGNDNVFVGHLCGKSNNASFDVIIGSQAVQSGTGSTGQNVIIGYQAGNSMTGAGNVYIGYSVAGSSAAGGSNVYIGANVAINVTGNQNVMIGQSAGFNAVASSQSGSVYIGFNAGQNETASNKLYIANTNTSTPLIKGDFSAKTLTFNADSGITTTGFAQTPGSSGKTFQWAANIAAPTTTLAGAVTNRYGGAANFLGDPTAWALVHVNGVDLKIPCY